MEPNKVIARYTNGRIVKGFTQDFFPNKDRFHVHFSDNPSSEPAEILIKDLKAVFFVRDFAGNPQYNERKKFLPDEKPYGRKVEVTFKDGEVLIGSTVGYEEDRPGFFIFPVDPQSNNARIFAVSRAVRKVRFL